MKELDDIDLEILAMLQENAETPIATIAHAVHLSQTPCWRRIQRLQEHGYITKRVALVSPKKVNVDVSVFVAVRTNQHNKAWFDQFSQGVMQIPEVVEFYRMSGEVDYLLRIVVPSIAAYDAVYQRLVQCADLYDVSSSFAMEQIKFTTAMPLRYARDAKRA